MTWRVLITAPYFIGVLDQHRSRLETNDIEIITASVKERLSEEELLPLIEDVDGVVCGDDRFTSRVLHQAKRLKVISKWGTGIDSIDLPAAGTLGILVCNTPNAFTDAVADSTFGYILNFSRRLSLMDREMREGRWKKCAASALSECSLGVVGVGNIGRAVVRRARAFGLKIFGNDPVLPDQSFLSETQLQMVSLPELLQQSDFVTLHCDLNPTSFHLLGAPELAEMRSGAYLINTARGPLIEELALTEALREKQIAGAALDVFEVEPLPSDSPLLSMENCLLAPHNANSDSAARKRVHESTIANLLEGLRRER